MPAADMTDSTATTNAELCSKKVRNYLNWAFDSVSRSVLGGCLPNKNLNAKIALSQ